MVHRGEWSKLDDDALDQCLWWRRRELQPDSLLSLGLVVRVLFGKCKDGSDQWSIWAGDDWVWPQRFLCPGCATHWTQAERYEDWPFGPKSDDVVI